jgi:hypothetical protein
VSDDIRPTADDMARDLRADLEFLRGAWGPSAAGYGAAAVRRAIAAEAEVERLRAMLAETDGHRPGSEDGTCRLCRAVYGREPRMRDYLGGSQAHMLHDAADLIARLRAEAERAAVWLRLAAWLAANKYRRCHVEASSQAPGRAIVCLMDHGDEGPTVVVCGYPAPIDRSGEDRTMAVWLFIDTTDVAVLLAATLDEWERTRGGGA